MQQQWLKVLSLLALLAIASTLEPDDVVPESQIQQNPWRARRRRSLVGLQQLPFLADSNPRTQNPPFPMYPPFPMWESGNPAASKAAAPHPPPVELMSTRNMPPPWWNSAAPEFNNAEVIGSSDWTAKRQECPGSGTATMCVRSAIAMSGGGSRAASCAVGGYRALTTANLMESFEGVSSVSGGTWASSIFMFASSNVSDETLLGSPTSPSELTLASLQTVLPPQAILTPISRSTIEVVKDVLRRAHKGKLSPNDMWIELVGEQFLEPFELLNAQFSDLSVRPGRPAHFVMGATIEAPSGYTTNAQSIQPFDMGADMTGSPLFTSASHTITYPPARDLCKQILKYSDIWKGFGNFKKKTTKAAVKAFLKKKIGAEGLKAVEYAADELKVPVENVIATCENLPITLPTEPLTVPGVGGEMQSFAANGVAPATFPRTGSSVPLPKPEVPFLLSRAVGYSSAAFAGLTGHTVQSAKVNPVQTIWPVEADSPAVEHFIGDGGNLDNSGLLTMIRRGAVKAIVFDSGDSELADSSVADFCDSNLNMTNVNDWASYTTNAFFGYGTDSLAHWFSNNQVFKKELLRPLLCDLQSAVAQGKPAVIHRQLHVLENTFWGIPASDKPMDVIFVFNYRCAEFVEKLPTETQDEIKKGKTGMFANFPYYSTMLQNPPELLTLSLPQAQLLAAHSEYAITENLQMIRDVLSNDDEADSALGSLQGDPWDVPDMESNN